MLLVQLEVQLMRNEVGRHIPDHVPGYDRPITPYQGEHAIEPSGRHAGAERSRKLPGEAKLYQSLREAIRAVGLKTGMTISFHHHLRNGDKVMNMVVDCVAEMGIKDLTIAPSSLNECNDPLVKHIETGVLTGIQSSGVRGLLAKAVTAGRLPKPLIIRSHGGRARAIESGELHIDVAFIAAPAADEYGNCTGRLGPNACGAFGYPMVDARYANKVVVVTDHLEPYPLAPISISQIWVDAVVKVESIGDNQGIKSGALSARIDPREYLLAQLTSQVIFNSGYFRQDFSMQLGAGGASLMVADFVAARMRAQGITSSFGLGGITKPYVDMLKEGLFKKLLDVQSFDPVAAQSMIENPNHLEICASTYANPHNKGAAVNLLDVVVLAALEVDTDYNVNVLTGSDGILRGASGGHSDAAAGAKLSIIVAPLVRRRIPIVIDRVQSVITPGISVDVMVTERGIAVNPARQDLIDNFKGAGLPVFSIHELKALAERYTGEPETPRYGNRVVGLIEYRDGSIIDVIHSME